MEAPSRWLSSCRHLDLRSESVYVQVTHAKPGGCFCGVHSDFLHGRLPTSPPCPVAGDQQICHCHHLLRRISHSAEQTRNRVAAGCPPGNGSSRVGTEPPPSRQTPAWTWTGHFTHLSASPAPVETACLLHAMWRWRGRTPCTRGSALTCG